MNTWDYILISIITSLVTAVLAYVGFWRQAKAEYQKDLSNRFNEKKWAAYVEFINCASKLLINEFNYYGSPPGNADYLRKRDEIDNDINMIGVQMWLLSSDTVLKGLDNWRSIYHINGLLDETSFHCLITLLNEMRNDLGNRAGQLDVGIMMGTMMPSFKKFIPH